MHVHRWLWRSLAAGCLVVMSACQATTRVTVVVGKAGDGHIAVSLTLDRQAAAQFPDLASQLRLDDLRRAGWTLSGPTTARDGSETVTIRRGFRDPAAEAVLAGELSGPNGPVRLHVSRRHGFVSTETSLTGSVDLRAGVDAFADSRLAAQLGLGSLAQGLNILHQGGADPGIHVEVAARLPGHLVHTNATVVDQTAVWTPALGRSLSLEATAKERNWVNIGLAAVGLVALVALVGVVTTAVFGLRLGAGGGPRRPLSSRRRRDSWRISERRRRW